jgi:hypothetical protein
MQPFAAPVALRGNTRMSEKWSLEQGVDRHQAVAGLGIRF